MDLVLICNIYSLVASHNMSTLAHVVAMPTADVSVMQ